MGVRSEAALDIFSSACEPAEKGPVSFFNTTQSRHHADRQSRRILTSPKSASTQNINFPGVKNANSVQAGGGF